MAARSGKGLQLRAAAEYAAVDTFYPCETVLTMGTGANCLRLYVASTVDNPGDVEFYVKHRAGNNKDWHDYCTSEDAPEVWGDLAFTDKDQFKSIELDGLNLYPGEQVKVYFRASLNAGVGGAQISIEGISFESATAFADIKTGYVQADNDNRVKETSPLDTRVSEVTLLDDTNVAAATHYYPSATGAEMTPYQAFGLWGKLIDADGTITVTVEATGRAAPVAADWEDVTKSFLDENLNTDTHASFTVTNGTLVFQIGVKRANFRRYRVKMVNNGATNTIVLEARRTAL